MIRQSVYVLGQPYILGGSDLLAPWCQLAATHFTSSWKHQAYCLILKNTPKLGVFFYFKASYLWVYGNIPNSR
jgi:hypothetical protein